MRTMSIALTTPAQNPRGLSSSNFFWEEVCISLMSFRINSIRENHSHLEPYHQRTAVSHPEWRLFDLSWHPAVRLECRARRAFTMPKRAHSNRRFRYLVAMSLDGSLADKKGGGAMLER